MVTVDKREGESCLSIKSTEGERDREGKEGLRYIKIQEMGESSNNVATFSLTPFTTIKFLWVSYCI